MSLLKSAELPLCCESQHEQMRKTLRGGGFKAACWPCWSGGNASVWSGSSSRATHLPPSSFSSSLYSLVTSLPYGPSPPFSPHPSPNRGEEHLPHDIPVKEGERRKERSLGKAFFSCSQNNRKSLYYKFRLITVRQLNDWA